MAPTFSPGYVAPGFYVQQQNIGAPNVPQGARIPAIIGQGAKTLVRQQILTRGTTFNGQDGPLVGDQAIDIISIVDSNNVTYYKGKDFIATRVPKVPSGTDLVVDWSPLSTLVGTVDLSSFTYPGDLGGNTLTFKVNKLDGTLTNVSIYFSSLNNPSDVVTTINNWDPTLGLTASLDVNNHLVLKATVLVFEDTVQNKAVGFGDGAQPSNPVQKPAAGVPYRVTYTSDKTESEYAPKLFSNMNQVIAYYGPKQGQEVIDSGTVTASSTDTLEDNTKSWAVNSVVGAYVKLSGNFPSAGQVRVVLSNTATTLTLSKPWNSGNEPVAGVTYTITDINENSITLGTELARRTGATFFIGSQYSDDLFNDSNIKLAIDNLKESVSGQDPDCLVLMRGVSPANTAPISYLKNHCEEMSNQLNNKFRVAIIGLASGNENYLDFATLAVGTHSRRIAIVNISSINYDFGDGRLLALDGSYVAAAVAGVYCAFVDAGEPITRKSVADAIDVNTFVDPFITTEKNYMAGAGILVIERGGTDIRIRHALTTDNTNAFTQELKLTRSADFISKYLRSNLESLLTGRRLVVTANGAGILSTARVNFTFLLENLRNTPAQIITAYENIGVTQNSVEKRQLDFTANIFLTTDVLWEFALLGFTV